MNRFDRVTALLILLQTKRVLTSQELAERFQVTQRTIYRDIRTLENAGVPILSEAGVGYSLDKSYRLPPVMFTGQEAIALMVAEKFLNQAADATTLPNVQSALQKIRAVLPTDYKDRLEHLSDRIAVQTSQQPNPEAPWLAEIQHALATNACMDMSYFTASRQQSEQRRVEPIGLYHYSRYWHLIAWCQTRQDYRDFRLDRIESLQLANVRFDRRHRQDLQGYLNAVTERMPLHAVTVRFQAAIAPFTHTQRVWHGFINERPGPDQSVEMDFLCSELMYFARWLLMYTDAVEVVAPKELKQAMHTLLDELHSRYGDEFRSEH